MGSIGASPEYQTLSHPIPGAPPVLIFFSFFSPRSYDWATKYQVAQSIRKSVPNGTEVHRYHVSSTDQSGWRLGHELTQAWAVATDLNVDDKVIVPLFESIRKHKSVTDLEGIRQVFEDCGVGKSVFDKSWAGGNVERNTNWQDEISRGMPRDAVPSVVVNGKYVIAGDYFDSFDKEDFGKQVAAVVKELLAKE